MLEVNILRHAKQADVAIGLNDGFVASVQGRVRGTLEKREGVLYLGQEIIDSDDHLIAKVLVCREIADGMVRIVTESTVPLELRIYPYGIKPADLLEVDSSVVPKKVKMKKGVDEHLCSLMDP